MQMLNMARNKLWLEDLARVAGDRIGAKATAALLQIDK
jgi:hypothetical protein